MRMGKATDRRPWLILSAREARALQAAVVVRQPVADLAHAPGDLARALRMIALQLQWIDGDNEGEEPDKHAALERECA
jgi:hypothetical protein